MTVDGGDNKVLNFVTCELDQTCCDWDCCNDDEECVIQNSTMKQRSSDFLDFVDMLFPGNNQVDFYYDFRGWDINAVEANNWKLPDGTDFQNRPRLCQKRKKFDPLQIVRTTMGPLIFLIFILWALVSFMFNGNIRDAIAQTRTVPPFAVLVTSIFLAFSPALSYGECSATMPIWSCYQPDSRSTTNVCALEYRDIA